MKPASNQPNRQKLVGIALLGASLIAMTFPGWHLAGAGAAGLVVWCWRRASFLTTALQPVDRRERHSPRSN